jgi:hypothetical protein
MDDIEACGHGAPCPYDTVSCMGDAMDDIEASCVGDAKRDVAGNGHGVACAYDTVSPIGKPIHGPTV